MVYLDYIIIVEIYHSGRKPSICDTKLQTGSYNSLKPGIIFFCCCCCFFLFSFYFSSSSSSSASSSSSSSCSSFSSSSSSFLFLFLPNDATLFQQRGDKNTDTSIHTKHLWVPYREIRSESDCVTESRSFRSLSTCTEFS